MAGLNLNGVSKFFGDLQVIHDVNLDIADGEFVVFVGPSGCGKSTLLRMIAGLEEISSGSIYIGKNEVNEVAPSNRGVAMVFQTYALYPHMSVYKNMSFALEQSGIPKTEVEKKVRHVAETLKITPLLKRTPRTLSGGQRQRVAIGRAIVREPDVFLFDEPLSNLDAALRVQTRLEIARLHNRLGTTMIYVTHDQVEAMTLADQIVVLKDGIVEQKGKPIDLYDSPQNKFVAEFIGSPKMNFFANQDLQHMNSTLAQSSEDYIWGARPEHFVECNKSEALFVGRLELVEHLGEYVLVHLIGDSELEFIAKMNRLPTTSKGEEIYFTVERERLHCFSKNDGKRILDPTIKA